MHNQAIKLPEIVPQLSRVSGYLRAWVIWLALAWHGVKDQLVVMKMSLALLIAVIMVSAEQATAQASMSGYLKSWLVVQGSISNDLLQADEIVQSQNVGRFMLETLGETAAFQLHYEASPVLASRNLSTNVQTFNRVGASYRMTDPQATLVDEAGGKRQVLQNLDRLNVQFRLDAGDLTLGRQAISFGAARFINPTDIFLPFDVQTFNTEYRTGVDALRFQRPWGDLGEIDFGLVLGADARRETSAAFLQLQGNVNGKDLNLALMEFSRQRLLGAGLQSELWDLGFWLEVAYVDGSNLNTNPGFEIQACADGAISSSMSRQSQPGSGSQVGAGSASLAGYVVAGGVLNGDAGSANLNGVGSGYAPGPIAIASQVNQADAASVRPCSAESGQHYFRASIGVDYAFTENVFGMVEYHYNGAGSQHSEEYLAAVGKLAYNRGGVFLLGQNYLLGNLGIQATPLWNINLQAIVNLDDDSAFTSLAAEWNLAEDLYMDFGIYAFAGRDLKVQTPDTNPAPGNTLPMLGPTTPVLQSEYGASPNILFASIRWYL